MEKATMGGGHQWLPLRGISAGGLLHGELPQGEYPMEMLKVFPLVTRNSQDFPMHTCAQPVRTGESWEFPVLVGQRR